MLDLKPLRLSPHGRSRTGAPSPLQAGQEPSRAQIVAALASEGSAASALLEEGHAVRVATIGRKVHFRGIVEFSNICVKDCNYCGIRKGHRDVRRFRLTRDEIVACARWAHDQRYGSLMLQSGERTDPAFVSEVEDLLRAIAEATEGRLGVSLSCGEQSEETYHRWYAAGAHRYLLRIESSNPELYARLHPADHSHAVRVACLENLRHVGFQVGTGVMIGLPGQTLEHLAEDVEFFLRLDVDMIGMGPYVVHERTPLGAIASNTPEDRERRLHLALKMIAICRIVLPRANIAATTALQALDPLGRERGLQAGANILMPILTPPGAREHYQLYDGKPCIDDTAEECRDCLERRVIAVGDSVGWSEWGDAPHARERGAGRVR